MSIVTGPPFTWPKASASSAPPATPQLVYPSKNDKGQRICRRCGVLGKYKGGNCVEKWGPGPMGPGTVCDSCRKKIKRLRQRANLDEALQQPQLTQSIPSHNSVQQEKDVQRNESDGRVVSVAAVASNPGKSLQQLHQNDLGSVALPCNSRSRLSAPAITPPHSEPSISNL
ncbi:hypothetical protein M378DRAFT_164413 [Amanita muscaria Koide BX008]|uniref:GATA-type domain-containing protein n=1 Tax=Amanita muscaria (strain Koide BX008) TaxID=946122 RepID=A0A0C2WPG2_AMAMK|nr:hypothetical protein M378DRAFT_164413 [Amanita muscaria Koide BX008]